MQTTTYPFTVKHWNGLTEEQKQAVEAVAIYLNDYGIPEQPELDDASISSALSILKPCPYCVPEDCVGEDLKAAIYKKFDCVYQVALELAEHELNGDGIKSLEQFSFCLIIEPSDEDSTHIVIVDYQHPTCYLHDWNKEWNFSFDSLAALANEVLRIKAVLVEKVTETVKPMDVYVVLEGGLVREVRGVPENVNITIVDYDIEGAHPEEIQISPLDGEACCIRRF
jgi:hypothetical protein